MRLREQALFACRIDVGSSGSIGSSADQYFYGPDQNLLGSLLAYEGYGPNAGYVANPSSGGFGSAIGGGGGGQPSYNYYNHSGQEAPWTPANPDNPDGDPFNTGNSANGPFNPFYNPYPPGGGGGGGAGQPQARGMVAGGAGGYQPMTNDISNSREGQAFLGQWRQGVKSGQYPPDSVPAVGPNGFEVIPKSSAPWAVGAPGASPGAGYAVGGGLGGNYQGSYTPAAQATPQSAAASGGFGSQSATPANSAPSGDGRMGITPVGRPRPGPSGGGGLAAPPEGRPVPPSSPMVPPGYVPPGGNPGSNPGGGPPVTGIQNPYVPMNPYSWGANGASGNRQLAGGMLYNVFGDALSNPNLDPATSAALREEGMNAARSSFAGQRGQMARHVAATGNDAGYMAGLSSLGRAQGQTLGQQARQNILDEEQLRRQKQQWASQGMGSLYSGETGYLGSLLGLRSGLDKMPVGKVGAKSEDTTHFGLAI